jgi:hypothetical protein
MRRLSLAVKRCAVCGRRLGLGGRAIEIEDRGAVHLACAWELVEDRSERPVEDLLAEWERLAVLVQTDQVVPDG